MLFLAHLVAFIVDLRQHGAFVDYLIIDAHAAFVPDKFMRHTFPFERLLEHLSVIFEHEPRCKRLFFQPRYAHGHVQRLARIRFHFITDTVEHADVQIIQLDRTIHARIRAYCQNHLSFITSFNYFSAFASFTIFSCVA